MLTGVFASAWLFSTATGATSPPAISTGGALYDGQWGQVVIQFFAASVSAVYAFALTLGLVKGIDVLFGFTLDAKAENEGVDRSEHGEVGFDLGLALEAAPEQPGREPRSATIPPNGKRHFTVVVQGPESRQLMKAWSQLCQAGPEAAFAAVQGGLPLSDHGAGQSFSLPRR